MHNELTNLLPPERQRALSREYFLRLSVVGIVLMNILVLAAALLLVPTYVFLTKATSAKMTRLATIESSFSSEEEKTLSSRLAALTNDAATLMTLTKASSASAAIREALSVPRPGITLSGFLYTPSTSKTGSNTLAVSGTAVTRDALRNYQLAFQNASFVRSAALPVSAYAKDSDITFTITMILAL